MTNVTTSTLDHMPVSLLWPYLSSKTFSVRCCLFYFQVMALLLISAGKGPQNGSFGILNYSLNNWNLCRGLIVLTTFLICVEQLLLEGVVGQITKNITDRRSNLDNVWHQRWHKYTHPLLNKKYRYLCKKKRTAKSVVLYQVNLSLGGSI